MPSYPGADVESTNSGTPQTPSNSQNAVLPGMSKSLACATLARTYGQERTRGRTREQEKVVVVVSFQYTVTCQSCLSISFQMLPNPILPSLINKRLVDGHPARDWPVLDIWQLSHVVGLLHIVIDSPLHDMWLQSHPKIRGAYAGVDDCHDNQDNRNSGETCQTLSDGDIILRVAGLVHSGELENEVRQSAEEQENGDDHSKPVLTPSPEGRHKEDENCHGYGGNCETKLSAC